MLHQKFALLREHQECGRRHAAWIDSSSDWFPRPPHNVRRVASHPLEQRIQAGPLVRPKLVDEQQYVASSSTRCNIEPDPVSAHDRSRPERRGARAPFRYRASRVGCDENRRRRGPRPPGECVRRDCRECREPENRGPGNEEGRNDQQPVQSAPPDATETRRARRQSQDWRVCVR
jgi:hypothetical protein